MTHEESSLKTKKALSTSLKNLMKHKAFSKITVSELIQICDVNRKTFYYHFEDIYALLKWTIDQEAIDVVKQFDLLSDVKSALLFVIDYVEKNVFFLNCIYDSVGREQLKQIFCHDFMGLVETIIHETEEKMHCYVDERFRKYLITVYTTSFVSTLIELFQSPESYQKDELMDFYDIMIKNSIPAVIKAKAAMLTEK